MEEQNYHTSISVNTGAKDAFKAINSICEWWSTDFEGGANKQGDIFTVRFGDTFITMKVVEFIPNTKIVWKVVDSWKHWMKSNNTEWIGTKISFDIAEKEDKVQVHFTHIGLVPVLDCFDVCSDAWNGYITGSLRNLINTGKGQPTQKENETVVSNN